MPKELGIRKNTIARRNTDERTEGTGVHQSLNVQAERVDLSGIQQGLKSLHGFYSKKKQEKDTLTSQQALFDASHDEVDLERLEDSRVYRETVNTQLGTNTASKRISQLQLDYKEKFDNDPNFDFDSWAQEVQGISEEQYDDPDFLSGYNSKMVQSLDILRVKHGTNVASKEFEQAGFIASEMFDTLIADGELVNTSPAKKDIEILYAQYSELGLSPEESLDSLAKSAMHYASNGKHEAAESLLEFIGKNSSNVGKYGRALKDVIKLSQKRKAAEDAKVEAVDTRKKYLIRKQFSDEAQQGRYNEALALEAIERKELSDSQALSFRDKALESQENFLVQAQSQKVAEYVLTKPTDYFRLDSTQQSSVRKHVDSQSQEMVDTLVSIIQSNTNEPDNTEFQLRFSATLDKYDGLFSFARETQQVPRAISGLMNASLDSPRFDTAVEMYKQLKGRTKGSLNLGINSEQAALMDSFISQTTFMGWSPEVAKERLSENLSIPFSQAKSQFRSAMPVSEFEDILRSELSNTFDGDENFIGGDVELYGVQGSLWGDPESEVDILMKPNMRLRIMDEAALNYRLTGDAEQSLRSAVSRIKNQFVPVNGNLIPRDKKPRQFFQAFHDSQDHIRSLESSGKVRVPEGNEVDLDSGFTLIPIDGHDVDGRMQVVPADNPAIPLVKKDGQSLVIFPNEFTQQYQERMATEREAKLDKASKEAININKQREARKKAREEYQKNNLNFLSIRHKF